MPRIPYRYPAPSTDAVADRIRQRRGARGLTPLDGMLLNAPVVADGWNTFVGGLRNRTSLRDDIRELMVRSFEVEGIQDVQLTTFRYRFSG
jgi:hypothetical protein